MSAKTEKQKRKKYVRIDINQLHDVILESYKTGLKHQVDPSKIITRVYKSLAVKRKNIVCRIIISTKSIELFRLEWEDNDKHPSKMKEALK